MKDEEYLKMENTYYAEKYNRETLDQLKYDKNGLYEQKNLNPIIQIGRHIIQSLSPDEKVSVCNYITEIIDNKSNNITKAIYGDIKFTFIDVNVKMKYKCGYCGRVKRFIFDKKCVETGGLWISEGNIPCAPYIKCDKCGKVAMQKMVTYEEQKF